jgi:hypothetical protein
MRLMLRDSKTWNPIASNLEPELPEFRLEDHSLGIQSYYPAASIHSWAFLIGPDPNCHTLITDLTDLALTCIASSVVQIYSPGLRSFRK